MNGYETIKPDDYVAPGEKEDQGDSSPQATQDFAVIESGGGGGGRGQSGSGKNTEGGPQQMNGSEASAVEPQPMEVKTESAEKAAELAMSSQENKGDKLGSLVTHDVEAVPTGATLGTEVNEPGAKTPDADEAVITDSTSIPIEEAAANNVEQNPPAVKDASGGGGGQGPSGSLGSGAEVSTAGAGTKEGLGEATPPGELVAQAETPLPTEAETQQETEGDRVKPTDQLERGGEAAKKTIIDELNRTMDDLLQERLSGLAEKNAITDELHRTIDGTPKGSNDRSELDKIVANAPEVMDKIKEDYRSDLPSPTSVPDLTGMEPDDLIGRQLESIPSRTAEIQSGHEFGGVTCIGPYRGGVLVQKFHDLAGCTVIQRMEADRFERHLRDSARADPKVFEQVKGLKEHKY